MICWWIIIACNIPRHGIVLVLLFGIFVIADQNLKSMSSYNSAVLSFDDSGVH